MRMNRRIWTQLTIFMVIAATALAVIVFGYMKLPSLVGVGRYTVTVQLPATGGLYDRGNVTYRGTEVGIVTGVNLTDTGVDAVLSLRSDVKIPSDLDAQVHSQTAVGEQYVALLPRNSDSPPLKNGDVIPVSRSTVPPDINALLDATNRGLQAIPQDDLKTAIDESYTAFSGLGPDIARLIKGGSTLAIEGRRNLGPLTSLIDQSKAVLDTQSDTADSVDAWAAHLADITGSLKRNDTSVQGLLRRGGAAAEEVRALFDRLQPTLPLVLANLVSLNEIAITYQPNIEQILVLLPQGAANIQAATIPDKDLANPGQRGAFLSFNLNLNLPSTCSTGFLPATQARAPSLVDAPDRPAGDLYCRVPQDSSLNVRGARNTPCTTVPGKRAPTVKMCESDEVYVPLNDGFNWKGDPNATLSGQGVPQRSDNTPAAPAAVPPPDAPPPPEAVAPPDAPPPIAAASYDPATGTYVGPDGQIYTQANLAKASGQERTWQSMLVPPTG